MEQQFRQFVTDHETLRKELEDAAAELAAERLAKESLEKDIEDMKRERKEHRRKYNSLKNTYRTDFEDYEKKLAVVKEDTAQQIYALGQNANAERTELRARHAAEIRQLQQQLGAANDKIKGQSVAMAAMQRQHDTLILQYDNQGQKLKDSTVDLDRAKRAISAAAERQREVEQRHAAQLKDMKLQYQQAVAALRDDRTALETDKAGLQTTVTEAKANARRLQVEIDKASKNIEASTARITELEEQRGHTETEVNRLKSDLTKTESSRAQAEIKIQSLEDELATARTERDTRGSTNIILQAEITALRREVEDAHQRNATVTAEHHQLTATHTVLQSTQECLAAAFDHLSEEHHILTNDYAALEANSNEIFAILGEMLAYQEHETADAVGRLKQACTDHYNELADAECRAYQAQMDKQSVKEARDYFANVQTSILALEANAKSLKKEIAARGQLPRHEMPNTMAIGNDIKTDQARSARLATHAPQRTAPLKRRRDGSHEMGLDENASRVSVKKY